MSKKLTCEETLAMLTRGPCIYRLLVETASSVDILLLVKHHLSVESVQSGDELIQLIDARIEELSNPVEEEIDPDEIMTHTYHLLTGEYTIVPLKDILAQRTNIVLECVAMTKNDNNGEMTISVTSRGTEIPSVLIHIVREEAAKILSYNEPMIQVVVATRGLLNEEHNDKSQALYDTLRTQSINIERGLKRFNALVKETNESC